MSCEGVVSGGAGAVLDAAAAAAGRRGVEVRAATASLERDERRCMGEATLDGLVARGRREEVAAVEGLGVRLVAREEAAGLKSKAERGRNVSGAFGVGRATEGTGSASVRERSRAGGRGRTLAVVCCRSGSATWRSDGRLDGAALALDLALAHRRRLELPRPQLVVVGEDALGALGRRSLSGGCGAGRARGGGLSWGGRSPRRAVTGQVGGWTGSEAAQGCRRGGVSESARGRREVGEADARRRAGSGSCAGWPVRPRGFATWLTEDWRAAGARVDGVRDDEAVLAAMTAGGRGRGGGRGSRAAKAVTGLSVSLAMLELVGSSSAVQESERGWLISASRR